MPRLRIDCPAFERAKTYPAAAERAHELEIRSGVTELARALTKG
jgi:hypothetical protein